MAMLVRRGARLAISAFSREKLPYLAEGFSATAPGGSEVFRLNCEATVGSMPKP